MPIASADTRTRRLALEALVACVASCTLVWSFWSLPVTGSGVGSLTSARQLAELDLSGVIPIHTPVLLSAYLLPFEAILGLVWLTLGPRARMACGVVLIGLGLGLAIATWAIAHSGIQLGSMWPVSLISIAALTGLVVHDRASRSGRTRHELSAVRS
jgi:hypothetical protein